MVYISSGNTVQRRAAIGTFISSQKDMGELEKHYHFTSTGTLFSSESRSSDLIGR